MVPTWAVMINIMMPGRVMVPARTVVVIVMVLSQRRGGGKRSSEHQNHHGLAEG